MNGPRDNKDGLLEGRKKKKLSFPSRGVVIPHSTNPLTGWQKLKVLGR